MPKVHASVCNPKSASFLLLQGTSVILLNEGIRVVFQDSFYSSRQNVFWHNLFVCISVLSLCAFCVAFLITVALSLGEVM